MPDVPNWLAGSLTVAILVGFGIFFYPWLLNRRRGVATAAAITAGLAMLYYAFDRGSATPALSAAFALLWAAAPLAVGVIVHRLQRR